MHLSDRESPKIDFNGATRSWSQFPFEVTFFRAPLVIRSRSEPERARVSHLEACTHVQRIGELLLFKFSSTKKATKWVREVFLSISYCGDCKRAATYSTFLISLSERAVESIFFSLNSKLRNFMGEVKSRWQSSLIKQNVLSHSELFKRKCKTAVIIGDQIFVPKARKAKQNVHRSGSLAFDMKPPIQKQRNV